jgi:hypothetical protein
MQGPAFEQVMDELLAWRIIESYCLTVRHRGPRRTRPPPQDLICKLLAYNPDERLSARQALRHPYFRDLRRVAWLGSGAGQWGRAVGQGSGAGQSGRAVGQGRRAGQVGWAVGQGSGAGQSGRTVG